MQSGIQGNKVASMTKMLRHVISSLTPRLHHAFSLVHALSLLAITGLLSGCNVETAQRTPARASAPIPQATLALMSEKQTDRNAPILIRAYKKEAEIEIWKQDRKGDYVLLKSYPVCRWSGQLGPKRKEGDRQVPEGFYTVSASQMNPFSSYWLAFNVGYPNPLEKAMGRSGGDIMVHGTCSSRGCFAMTDAQIEEIYAVMREAFNAGQKSVQFQSFPFHMTAENLAKFRHDPNMPYWKNLKEGSDHFEVTKREPKINYCGQRYVFNAESAGHLDPANPCPALTVPSDLARAVQDKQKQDAIEVASLIEKGTQAIRMSYADGGQNEKFRSSQFAMAGDDRMMVTGSSARINTHLGDVSRPEALDAIHEVAINDKGEAIGTARPVQMAASQIAASSPLPIQNSLTSAPASPAVEQERAQTPPPSAVSPVKTASATPVGKGAGSTAPKNTPAEQQPSASLFGATFSDLSNIFRAQPSAAQPLEKSTGKEMAKNVSEEKNGFYNKLINVITPSPAEAETKPDLPAKVPLPPRRQASLGLTQVQ